MKEEKEAEGDKGPLAEPKGEAKKKDCSRRRRRSRSRSRRSRTRRRSREKKDKKRGSPSPEKKKEVDKKPTSPPAEEDDGVEVATDEEEEEAAPEEIKDEWGGALVNTSFSSLTTIKQGSQNPDEPVGFPRRLSQPRQAVIHLDKPKHYGTRSLGYSLFTPGGGLPKSEITPLSLFALQHICQN